MAKQVDKFPLIVHRSVYPWAEWLDGNIWELARGEDFTVKPSHMQQATGAAARKRGLEYTTRSIGDKVYIQARRDAVAEPESKP